MRVSPSRARLAKLLAAPSLPPPQLTTPTPAVEHIEAREETTRLRSAELEAREETIKLLRSERMAGELNAVRAQLAACQLKLTQLEAFRTSERLGLETEVQARTRGESLMRSRCEQAERERAQMHRTLIRRQQGEARVTAEGQAVELARFAARDAARDVTRDAERDAPREAAEVHRRRARQGHACRRLGYWVEARQRGVVLHCLHDWRAAAAAVTLAEEMAGAGVVVAGELRTAQWGESDMESEQAAAQGDAARQLRQSRAVGRVCVWRAERAGRCNAERRGGLRGAWQQWLLLLLAGRLEERARDRTQLVVAVRGEAATRVRAESLAKDMGQLRGVLATLQQRATIATATAEAARADAAREAMERSRAEVARRSDRTRCEALEREVARLQRARKAPAPAHPATRKSAWVPG